MEAIRVLISGGYRNRTPLAYAPVRAALGEGVVLVDTPAEAQILLIGHYRDIDLFGHILGPMLRDHPHLRLVLLSEEPYWDSVWMSDPFTRRQTVALPTGQVACAVLNHVTTRIYRAARIPYFLLTDPRYIARYRPRFDRNAGRSAQDWQRHFAQVPLDAAFVAARRTSARVAPQFGGDALRGLSVWRTRFAEACAGARVLRQGEGWAEAPPRQSLPDWHADKLDRLDLRVRYLSAFENTHQDDYISEKIWDAFAVGAIPLYAAGPGHALRRLIGGQGWLDFHAAWPDVPVFDAAQPVSADLAAGFAAQQERLAVLFHDPAAVAAELDRLAAALLSELRAVLPSEA
jgi:hypothetical protein